MTARWEGRRRGAPGKVILLLAAAAWLGWCLPAAAAADEAATGGKHRLARLVERVEPVLRRWGYPAIFGVVAVDTAGVPAPAASIMVAATLAADRKELHLWAVALVAFAAAAFGSQVGYAVGRVGGRALLGRLPLSPARLATFEGTFARWGPLIVVWAPFAEGLRQLSGLLAGTMKMPWWRFAPANLLGSALFVALWVGGAWLVDEHLAVVMSMLRATGPWLIGGTVLGVALLFIHLRRSHKEVAAAKRPALTPARTRE